MDIFRFLLIRIDIPCELDVLESKKKVSQKDTEEMNTPFILTKVFSICSGVGALDEVYHINGTIVTTANKV